jgi:hypothetical protein
MDGYEVRLNNLMYSEYCKIKNSYILATEFGCFLLSQSSRVGILVNKSLLEQVFSPSITVSLVSIIQLVFRTHLLIYQKGCVIISIENSFK